MARCAWHPKGRGRRGRRSGCHDMIDFRCFATSKEQLEEQLASRLQSRQCWDCRRGRCYGDESDWGSTPNRIKGAARYCPNFGNRQTETDQAGLFNRKRDRILSQNQRQSMQASNGNGEELKKGIQGQECLAPSHLDRLGRTAGLDGPAIRLLLPWIAVLTFFRICLPLIVVGSALLAPSRPVKPKRSQLTRYDNDYDTTKHRRGNGATPALRR